MGKKGNQDTSKGFSFSSSDLGERWLDQGSGIKYRCSIQVSTTELIFLFMASCLHCESLNAPSK